MTPADMKKRTKQFGLRVINLVASLPRNNVCYALGQQLLRSGTSVGSNYRAACRSRSTAEFLAKLGVVEEECDESNYWIEMLVDSHQVKANAVANLLKEGNEILAIIVSSIVTTRKNDEKNSSENSRTTKLTRQRNQKSNDHAKRDEN